MLKFRSSKQYWEAFASYQTFSSIDEMNALVKRFKSIYELTPAVESVLNTIKLHAKQFIGVCWLYREEIARKAKVSLSSVKRAIKALQESGILTIHRQNHTKRGGQTHNVYVINPVFETPEEPVNEPASVDVPELVTPVAPMVCENQNGVHKNLNTNPNTSLNHLSIKVNDELKFVPDEFIDLMEPFYANNPEIIRDRWKTVCVAVKRNCGIFSRTSWDTIGRAWKDTVQKLKRGRVRKATDDGIGGYFYGVLCDYLTDDFFRSAAFA